MFLFVFSSYISESTLFFWLLSLTLKICLNWCCVSCLSCKFRSVNKIISLRRYLMSFKLNCLFHNSVLFVCFKTRLIIKLSFELTFWTQINVESSCSYFQLDATRLDWELSQLDSTRQELKLDVKRAKYRNFSDFCIIFLIESHEEKTWRSFDKRSWQET